MGPSGGPSMGDGGCPVRPRRPLEAYGNTGTVSRVFSMESIRV